MTLARLLGDPATKVSDLEVHLDGLSASDRVRQTIKLSRPQQERL